MMERVAQRAPTPLLGICLLSAVGFFLELWCVRFVGTTLGELAYYSNLLLLSGILGFCAGLLTKASPQDRILRRLTEMAAALLVLQLVTIYFGNGDLTIQDATEFFWFRVANLRPKGNPRDLTLVGFVICVLITLTLLPIGRAIAAEFEALRERRLPAYLANVIGGILGSVAFCLLLSQRGSPFVLFCGLVFLVGLLVLTTKMHAAKGARPGLVRAVVLPVLLLTAIGALDAAYGGKYMWSPYYRVSLVPDVVQLQSRPSLTTGYHIQANHFFISGFSSLTPEQLEQVEHDLPATATEDRRTLALRRTNSFDYLPYRVADKLGVRDLLMLGTCAGNELGYFLRRPSIEKATAVEIDPVFVRLGMTREAKRAYDDPRVRLVVGDARQFLESAPGQHDMVYFAFLDSQTSASNLSRFRLDSFVFTQQGMRRMLEAVKPGGVLCIAFASIESWMAGRFYRNLTEVNDGIPPAVLKDEGAAFLFFATPHAPLPASAIPAAEGYGDVTVALGRAVEANEIRGSTDDWPYLYLRSPEIPVEYAKFMLIFALLAVIVVGSCGGWQQLRWTGPNEIVFALLGFGFFLLEVRTISVSAVALGVTLYAQAGALVLFTFCSFLGSLLCMVRPSFSLNAMWLALLASLAGNYFVGVELLAHLTGGTQKLFLVLLALPMVFSGYIFARYFGQAASPGRALGWNVLGGVLGGLSESLALVVGFRSLVLIAICAYALALVAGLPWDSVRAQTSPAGDG